MKTTKVYFINTKLQELNASPIESC